MKKNDCIVVGLFDLVYLLSACVVAKILAGIGVRFANVLVPVSFYAGAIISVAVEAAVTLALICILAFHDGYRYAVFDRTISLVSAGAAALIHFLLGLALRFTPLLFGPVRDLAGLISFGSFYNSAARIQTIPYGALAAVGIVTAMVYAGAMLLMNFLGCRKRLRDRSETTGAGEASI